MERRRFQRMLVASDGERAADAALQFAKHLSQRDGAHVEVVAVLAPRVMVPADMPARSNVRQERRRSVAAAELAARVERQVRQHDAAWPVQVRVGSAAWLIAESARAVRADLILVGHPAMCGETATRPRHHTAEQIACAADIAVLAVCHCERDVALPRVAVVVRDGSEAADRAQELVDSLMAPDATVHAVTKAVSPDLTDVAKAVGAQLIALPLAGPNFQVRTLMSGGVVDVLEHAPCSVLITPSPQPCEAVA